MIRFKKKWSLLLLPAGLMGIMAIAWVPVSELSRQYPDMNFSKAQLTSASWYSENDKSINENTANGEVFDDEAMTCATDKYPFGKKLLVVNPLNGKHVVCRVNDRGPAKKLGRGVDLTLAAFKKIANPKKGVIYVTVIPLKE